MQTGAIEAVKQEKAVPEKGGRNYELDFFRLVFALLVFIYHTNPFIGKNTRVVLPPDLGAGAVHFFFILSGMFMANSIVKRGVTGNCAKLSIGFVLNKFKSFAPEYFAALFIGVTAKVVFSDGGIMVRLARMFPEIFCVYASGVWYNNNAATWYLSAMLICMLPLAYLLYAKRDLTLYVIAPLVSILTFGYMCQTNNFQFIYHVDMYGILMGSIIRGMCGLCSGICAYTIYVRIKNASLNKHMRFFLTVAEVIMYLIFFSAWFGLQNNAVVMSIMIMFPVPLAVTFSGKSYVGELFRFKWMRHFAPLSLIIYLNHGIAQGIVSTVLPGRSYKMCLKWMIILTVAFCIINTLLVKGGRALWNRKLKEYFTKPDVE